MIHGQAPRRIGLQKSLRTPKKRCCVVKNVCDPEGAIEAEISATFADMECISGENKSSFHETQQLGKHQTEYRSIQNIQMATSRISADYRQGPWA